jgi:hypothetical protein
MAQAIIISSFGSLQIFGTGPSLLSISALLPETLDDLMEKLYAYMTPLYQPPSIWIAAPVM